MAGTSAWTDSLAVQPGAVNLAWISAAGATAYVVAHDFPADATGKGEWHSLTQNGTTATVAGLAPNAAGLSLPSLPVAVTPAP